MLAQAFNIAPHASANHTQLHDVTSPQPFHQLSVSMDRDQSSGIEDGLYSFNITPRRGLDHQFASGVEQPFRFSSGMSFVSASLLLTCQVPVEAVP